ncbi:hypothetical protein F5884DRAFT_250613 [Xylogone sp. PMI_703]|nr:hypothetical protein F5884DRAFT_250613 [Xylogone sp. PMI_703]
MVDIIVGKEASRILGAMDDIKLTTAKYFRTIHIWMPVIAKERFYRRLPDSWITPHADFIVLLLCIHFISQNPSEEGEVKSSLYAMIKSLISLLESAGYLSVEVVQSRLLMSIFEMSHGIHPAASISIAACARIGDALSLNKKWRQAIPNDPITRASAEDERCVWWATIIVDRFINLCNGEDLFSTKDADPCDLLPMHDELWNQDTMTSITPSTLLTPSNVYVGALARECQISHLIGRVLRHVFEPAPDPEFNTEEAVQLERTLDAYNILLLEEASDSCEWSCAAVGMCSSALLMLYQSSLLSKERGESERNDSLLSRMNTLSSRIVYFSKQLFGGMNLLKLEGLSPFVPIFPLSGSCRTRSVMDENW